MIPSAEKNWDDPIFSPAFFWMWNGPLDADPLCAQLDDMRSHGIRNVCIHPFPKGFRPLSCPSAMEPDYLAPGYLDVLARVVEHAGELGMHAYLYDEGGWPSGGACGLVAASDPEGAFLPREVAVSADGRAEVRMRPCGTGAAIHPSPVERGAAGRFISITHDAIARAVGGSAGSVMRVAFTDEPDMQWDDPGRSLAWASDMAGEFLRRKGYDIMPHVPALLGDPSQADQSLDQYRIDLQDVRSDLFVERFLVPLREWCAAHGMLSGGHLNNENEPQYGSLRGHGSIMRSLRAMDVPGVDAIWRQLFPSPQPGAAADPYPRYASSAMHQNGGTFALSESFAIYGDSLTPAEMKWTVDCQMARGINLFVFAYFAQSNARHWMTLFEPHSGPAVPYWDFEPHFFRYVERTARILAAGKPGAETVVAMPTREFWAGRPRREAAAAAHFATAAALDRMNCDYDFAEDREIARAEILPCGLLGIGAMRYSAVVVPGAVRLSPEAEKTLDAFAEAGGTVARGNGVSSLAPTLRVTGPGAAALRVMKRIDGGRAIWFVFNEEMGEREVRIEFPGHGPVVRYDPEDDAFWRVAGDGALAKTFRAGETAIYITGDVPDAPMPPRFAPPSIRLDSGWTLRPLVSHVAGKEDFEIHSCQEGAQPVALGDWRGVLGGTFSGKALYECEFESNAEGDALLDIGDVRWCAAARMNGTDLGARFFGPFQWRVRVACGRNVLQVTVANLLANQVGDDAIRDRILRDYQPNGSYDRFQRPFDHDNHDGGLFRPVSVSFEGR